MYAAEVTAQVMLGCNLGEKSFILASLLKPADDPSGGGVGFMRLRERIGLQVGEVIAKMRSRSQPDYADGIGIGLQDFRFRI